MDQHRIDSYADRIVGAFDSATTIDPITDADDGFDLVAAYRVLDAITSRRTAAGWRVVGRKIGFTNTTIWPLYGVDRPMWAPVYDQTVRDASSGAASVPIGGLVQGRIEPEVVFGLRWPLPVGAGSDREILEAVDWVAAGFELVQCPFPGWRFKIADCSAAAGLHGGLVIGARRTLDDTGRDRVAQVLARFEVRLEQGGRTVSTGTGANVLGSPALALKHLADALAAQPGASALGPGEIVTTGTLTDAAPIEAGQRWRADYGELRVESFELTLT